MAREYTTEDILSELQVTDPAKRKVVQVRLAQLRLGHKTRTTTHAPQLEEGRHWRKVARSVVFTEEGKNEAIRLLENHIDTR